jgi:putative beta-lysine N-acetyltransferase
MATAAPTAEEIGVEYRISGDGFKVDMIVSELNSRIQVLHYHARDPRAMVLGLLSEARRRGFGKIFLKAPDFDREPLEAVGMVGEATIAGYFSGQPAFVMSLFVREDRMEQPFAAEQEEILSAIRSRTADPSLPELPPDYAMTVATPADAGDLARLYGAVFASYPFPITDPEYLRSTMESHVVYRIIRDGDGDLVAAASAETCRTFANAEMTDFATLPNQRGLGLAQHLLAALEGDMLGWSIPNLYTIARARSAGMNRVFYNRGYELTGTLVNNCHIAGRFEDMHVWCKRAATADSA